MQALQPGPGGFSLAVVISGAGPAQAVKTAGPASKSKANRRIGRA
jgi:hypothetical protein